MKLFCCACREDVIWTFVLFFAVAPVSKLHWVFLLCTTNSECAWGRQSLSWPCPQRVWDDAAELYRTTFLSCLWWRQKLFCVNSTLENRVLYSFPTGLRIWCLVLLLGPCLLFTLRCREIYLSLDANHSEILWVLYGPSLWELRAEAFT